MKSRHKRNGTRKQRDEAEYDARLRESEAIKAEVIVDLRCQLREVSVENQKLRRSLAEFARFIAGRMQPIAAAAESAVAAADDLMKQDSGGCAYGCQRHRFDTVDGWMRRMPDGLWLAAPAQDK